MSPAADSMADTLRAAMNAARKAQDKDRTLVLGTILANLKNREIDLRRSATDEEVVEVLRKGIKIRREAIEQYQAGGRTDLADVEQAQIAVLEEFLPPAVDPEERSDEGSSRRSSETRWEVTSLSLLPAQKPPKF